MDQNKPLLLLAEDNPFVVLYQIDIGDQFDGHRRPPTATSCEKDIEVFA